MMFSKSRVAGVELISPFCYQNKVKRSRSKQIRGCDGNFTLVTTQHRCRINGKPRVFEPAGVFAISRKYRAPSLFPLLSLARDRGYLNGHNQLPRTQLISAAGVQIKPHGQPHRRCRRRHNPYSNNFRICDSQTLYDKSEVDLYES